MTGIRRADPETVRALAERLALAGEARLGRSLTIRHVDAGSCGGCEIALAAARRLREGLGRYGISFVDTPRDGDVLLVTGVATAGMAEAVRATAEAMPLPRFVIAVGDCAIDGGLFRESPSVLGGVQAILPVDLVIGGCPPPVERIVDGLIALLEANAVEPRRRRNAAGETSGAPAQGRREPPPPAFPER